MMLENVHNNAMWKKRQESNTVAKTGPHCLSMYIIQKTLESNTLTAYYHLALCGLETTGNFILFFELFWFCQTLFNVHLELPSSVKYVFKSYLSFEDVIHTHTHIHTQIHTIEYYSAKKKKRNNATWSNMDGLTHYHTKWSKSEWERQISYDITYMWNLKKVIQKDSFTKQRLTDIENKLTVTNVWDGGRDKLRGWD